MKYLNLAILMSFFTIIGSTYAQEKSLITEKLSLTVPRGAHRIKELKNTRTFNFAKHSVINKNKKSGETYILDKAALQIYYFEEKVEKDRLIRNKESFEGDFLLAKAKNTKSYLKRINDYQVFVGIYEIELEQNGFITFIAVNNGYTKTLTGNMEYLKSDRRNALRTLDELLNSIRFKK